MAVRITCINKDAGDHYDPHEGITHLGWINENSGETGKCTRSEMINFLEVKGGKAYVTDAFSNKAYLVVRTSRYSTKYVKTLANGRESDNLLNLKECS